MVKVFFHVNGGGEELGLRERTFPQGTNWSHNGIGYVVVDVNKHTIAEFPTGAVYYLEFLRD